MTIPASRSVSAAPAGAAGVPDRPVGPPPHGGEGKDEKTNEGKGDGPVTLPRGAIAVLSLAGFGSAVSLRVADPLLPHLSALFETSLAAAAMVVTMFSLAYGIAQLAFGPLGDRYGKYRVIGWGALACIASSLACALAPGLPSLVAARLLAGATAASIIPLSMAWIGDVVPYEQRQPVLARFLIGQIVGVSGGVLIGGYAADHLSWRTPFVGIALLFALIAALLFAIHRRLPPAARRTRDSGRFSVGAMVREFRQVLARPWAQRVLSTVFLEGLCVFGAFAFVATHLHQRFGLPLASAGAVVMLYGLGGALYALVAGALVRRLGETGLSIGGALLMAGSLVLVGLAPDWRWAVPGCLACGLGFYMLHNTLQINATQMAPERRGAAVSAFASCFFLGQAAGVALAGALVGWLGTGGLIAAGGAGVLAVGLAFARLRARRGAVTASAG